MLRTVLLTAAKRPPVREQAKRARGIRANVHYHENNGILTHTTRLPTRERAKGARRIRANGHYQITGNNAYWHTPHDEQTWKHCAKPQKTAAAAAAAESLQSCPTLCDPTGGSPPGSTIPGILQARTLEWVAISFSGTWKWKVKVKSLSRVLLLATPWTVAYQAPLSMGFSRQEYWSGVPLPSPTKDQN